MSERAGEECWCESGDMRMVKVVFKATRVARVVIV